MAKKKKDDEDEAPAPGTQGPTPVHIGGESILDRLIPHVKKIMVAAVVIAVILGGFFGYRWWKDRKRAAETAELTKAMEVLRADVVAPEPAGSGSGSAPAPDDKKDKPPSFPTHKARAEAGLAALAKGGAGKVGNLYRAGLLLQAGKLDEAEQAYRAASTAKGVDGILAKEGLGFVAEARAQLAPDAAQRQKHLEAALAAFRSMQPDDKGPLRDHALYHEGRMLAWMEKKPEAIAALEKALEVAPESELGEQIEARLAQLEARQ